MARLLTSLFSLIMNEEITYSGYDQLIDGIGSLLQEAKARIASSVNTKPPTQNVRHGLTFWETYIEFPHIEDIATAETHPVMMR
jgi:hypothetical protein